MVGSCRECASRVAATGMILLLLGAVITHRRAADSGKQMAPALLALATRLTYLAISLAG
jgi:hypothetical protein